MFMTRTGTGSSDYRRHAERGKEGKPKNRDSARLDDPTR
jgi:hypothetical protein